VHEMAGSGGGLVRVDTWSGLVLVGFGKSLATEEQFEVEMEMEMELERMGHGRAGTADDGFEILSLHKVRVTSIEPFVSRLYLDG
jgi:hypothetical protein